MIPTSEIACQQKKMRTHAKQKKEQKKEWYEIILMSRVLYFASFFQTAVTCTCSTNLCNKNWVEAGSTDHPVDTTEAPSDPIQVLSYKLGQTECSAYYNLYSMTSNNPLCSVLNVTHLEKGSVLMTILVLVRSVSLGMGA